MSSSPQPVNNVSIDRRVNKHDYQIVNLGLGDQHAIERVAMGTRQPSRTFGTVDAYRQPLKSSVGETGRDSNRGGSTPGNLSSRCLAVISFANAAVTRISIPLSAITWHATLDRRALSTSHHRNAWVSNNTRIYYPPFQALSSSSGKGSKMLSGIMAIPLSRSG